MRIAFYITTVLEYGGGLEKYLIETAAALNKLPGVTADIVSMDNRTTDRMLDMQSIFYMKKLDKSLSYKEDLKDIKRRLGKAHYYKESNIKALRERLSGYDVIYSKNELVEAFVLKFLVRYKTVPPIVFGGHTAIWYPHADSFYARLHNRLYAGWLYRFMASGVHKFHALNTSDAKLYKKLFPTRDVATIYNPFDVADFRKQAKGSDYKLEGFNDEAINILWVGRLTEQKGVVDLPNIVAAVNKRVSGAKKKISWNIFGDGEQRAVVEALAESTPNVHYYGHVDQKYIAGIYQRHQVFISVSRWEGYPYNLIEPQIFGLEIVARNIPGVCDVLADYGGAHLVDDVDGMIEALVQVLAKPEKLRQSPRPQPSDQFNPQKIYKKLVKFMETA